jgi:hypothetical protein
MNYGGAVSGAMSGAKLGNSILPGWGTGIGALAGGVMGAFGGGMSPEEKLALQQQRTQLERSNQFWQQARSQMGAAQNYFAPIAGGSRGAAMEAMAPEIQGATQRMDAGRQSLINLSGRSGGASARVDPYAKANVASNILQKARPGAASAMMDMSKTTGGWAAQNQAGVASSMMDYAEKEKARKAEEGKAFYDQLQDFTKWGKDTGWGGLKGKRI